jgi:Flp pilus assembly protein TadD
VAQPGSDVEQVEGQDEEFDYRLEKGSELLAAGDPEGARAALARAEELRPRDLNVLGLLGQACYRLGRYDEAVVAWQRLVDESPAEPAARVNLGLACLRAHRQAEATKQLEVALDLNPEHRKAMGYLGLALLEGGDPLRARDWFRKAGTEQMVARCDQLLAAAAAEAAPGLAAEPRPDAEPAAEAQVEPEVEAEVEAAPEPQPEPQPEVEPEAVLEAQAEVEPEAAPEPEPQADVAPEASLEPEPEPAAEAPGEPEPFSGPFSEPSVEEAVEEAFRLAEGPGLEQAAEAAVEDAPISVIDPLPDPEPPELLAPQVANAPSAPLDQLPAADDAALPVEVDVGELAAAAPEPPSPVELEPPLPVELEPPPPVLPALHEELPPEEPPPPAPPAPPPPVAEPAAQAAEEALAGPPAAPDIAAYAGARQVQIAGGTTFGLADGLVVVQVRAAVRVRLRGLLAARGGLRAAPEVKRFRGRPTERHFGEGEDRLHRIQGSGLLLFAPGARRFTPLALGVEPAFFREEAVFGFEEPLAFDNGRVPSPGGGELNLVHLRGQGAVLLATTGEPRALEVLPDAPLRVPVIALVGWVGALTPRLVALLEGGLAGALGVELTGAGTVLLDAGRAGGAEEP